MSVASSEPPVLRINWGFWWSSLQVDNLLEWLTEPRETLCLQVYWALQVAQWQRIHLSMQEAQETWVQSLGWVSGSLWGVPGSRWPPSDSKHVSMDLIWTLGVCGATAGLAWAFLVQQDVDITQWNRECRANGQMHAPVNTLCLVPAVSLWAWDWQANLPRLAVKPSLFSFLFLEVCLIWKEITLPSDSTLYSQNCVLSKTISFSFIWHSPNRIRVLNVMPKALAEESWIWRIFPNSHRKNYFILQKFLLFLRYFFDMDQFLKSFIEFVTILLLFMSWSLAPRHAGSWPGIKPVPPALEGEILVTDWITRMSPRNRYFKKYVHLKCVIYGPDRFFYT